MTIVAPPAGKLSPVTDGERADVLDALRGFAPLGIFMTHVPDFSGYSFLSATDRHSLDHFGLDAPLAWVSEFLIRGKFFSLFSSCSASGLPSRSIVPTGAGRTSIVTSYADSSAQLRSSSCFALCGPQLCGRSSR